MQHIHKSYNYITDTIKCTTNSANNSKDQSYLAICDIAVNWGFQLPNLLFLWGALGPCLVQCYLGPKSVPVK